jgi:hypothetical protein
MKDHPDVTVGDETFVHMPHSSCPHSEHILPINEPHKVFNYTLPEPEDLSRIHSLILDFNDDSLLMTTLFLGC